MKGFIFACVALACLALASIPSEADAANFRSRSVTRTRGNVAVQSVRVNSFNGFRANSFQARGGVQVLAVPNCGFGANAFGGCNTGTRVLFIR